MRMSQKALRRTADAGDADARALFYRGNSKMRFAELIMIKTVF